jgi:hypothetical protein
VRQRTCEEIARAGGTAGALVAIMLAKAAALITLLAATPSVAEPKTESVERVRYDTKRPPPRANARPMDGAVELASPTPARHATEYIIVDKGAGPFDRLRVDTTGKVILRRIKVYFADGTRRVIPVGKTLYPTRSSTVVELRHDAPIEQIVVDTEPTRGSYTVHGLRPTGSVAKR